MYTVYQNIAKDALINWMQLSTEEATKKIESESVDELESEVYAKNSIKYAIVGIAKELRLTDDESAEFYEAVINGPILSSIFEVIKNKAMNLNNEQILNISSVIHDGWVRNNANQKTYEKKVSKKQLRQYVPLEFIGFNEVESDLLFLNPILKSINISVDKEELKDSYHQRVKKHLSDIKTKDELKIFVKSSIENYSFLNEEIRQQLMLNIEEITDQIINNWNIKDPDSSLQFTDVKKHS